MRSIPRARGAAAALALCGLAAVPAPAAAKNLLTTTLSAPQAKERRCHARLADGAGVVHRKVSLDRASLVRARLSGSRGDWDLGVFDVHGRSLAGSAAFGTREVAEGFAAPGTLTVQACRRTGASGRPRLQVSATALPKPSGRKQISKLVNVKVRNDEQKKALQELDLDLTEHGGEGFLAVVLHGAADERKLRRSGLGYSVQIADMAARTERNQRATARFARATRRSTLPSGRDDYRRLPDYEADMKRLVSEHPEIVKPVTLPHKSLEGRTITGIEISENVGASDGKPVFLQLGVHHAREWPSSEHAMEWAFELVNGYVGKDARVVDLMRRTRTIVVPVVNPDGFNLSREAEVDLGFLAKADPYLDPILIGAGPVLDQTVGDPALTQAGLIAAILFDQEAGFFAYKRRNCRVADGTTPGEGECGERENRKLGVDPNRNYGGFWGGPGASSSPRSDTYRGAAPFSEPETQNIRELVAQRQVTTLITNHTFSNLVLRPPGIKAEGETPDEPLYKQLGAEMTSQNGYANQFSYELYDTTGTTEDWSYYATGGLGFTFEIGPHEFHPPFEEVVAEYEGTTDHAGEGGGNREAYFKALESTANTQRHGVIEGEAAPGATLKLRKQFTTWSSSVIAPDGKLLDPIQQAETLESTMTVPADGSFTWHVNPSQRPFNNRDRVFTASAGEPTKTTTFGPQGPPTPGAGEDTFPLVIAEGDPRAVVRIAIDVADTDDYDLYLHEGETATSENQIGSSGGFLGVDEQIVRPNLAPGTYTIRVVNYAATQPYAGIVEQYPDGKRTVVPAQHESWTLSCERGGRVVSSEQVDVARGQRVDVGRLCAGKPAEAGKGGEGERGNAGRRAESRRPVTVSGRIDRLRYAYALDRRPLARALRHGVRARSRCSAPCRRQVALVVSERLQRHLGLRSAVVARGGTTKTAPGRRVFKVRFSREARVKMRRLRRANMRMLAVTTDQRGQRKVTRKRYTLFR